MSESVVNDIVKWLESQLQRNEGIKIDTIADKSGYSKWHLQRVFKEMKGCNMDSVHKLHLLVSLKNILIRRQQNSVKLVNCLNAKVL